MKRTLSLLLALVMVIAMVPAVFAETTDDPEVDFDELMHDEHPLNYTDNGDGTHTVTCSVCENAGSTIEPHTDEDSDNVCDACEANLEPVMPTDENLKFYRANPSGGDLMLQDDIRASFMIDIRKLTYDEIYLEFTMNGVTTTAYKDATSNASVSRFSYVVRAPYMTTEFTAAIYGVKDNVTYQGEVLTFSVRKCVDAKMVNWHQNGQTSQCNLAMALLHYGARTQLNFPTLETGELATNNLPEAYQVYFPTESPTLASWSTDGASKQVTIYNMGLLLQEKVKLSTIFRSTTDLGNDIAVEVKHHNSQENKVDTYTYTRNDTDYVQNINNKNFRFYFDKLKPNQLRDQLEITVYENGAAVSTTFVRSVDMILNQSNYLTSETARELSYAIVNYADCAKVVFG